MTRKRQSVLLVFVLVIIIAIGWAFTQTSEKEALEIAADAAGVKGGVEAITEDQYSIGKYYQENKQIGYDIQIKYNNMYYFYTIAKKHGTILGSEKTDHVDEFPVTDFPVIVKTIK